MKRIFGLLLICAVLAACNGNTKNEDTPIEMSIDTAALSFGNNGGEQSFTVTAAQKVFVVPKDSWLSARTGDADPQHKTVVTITAAPNEDYAPRESRLTVVAGDERQYVTVTQAAKDKEPEPEPVENAAWTVAKRLSAGWNLGNQMDAHINGKSDETSWGNPKTTQALFDALKKAGFSSVRIPVTWMGHIDDDNDYKIEDAWLDRVAEIVGYAEKAGLCAIINMHHDGADSAYWLDIKTAAADDGANRQIVEKLTTVWRQIAEKFADKGDFLIFESMNEIHDGGWGWGDNLKDGDKQYARLNEWNQAFVDAVRAAGGNNANRYLGVPGYCTNIDLTVQHFRMPTDTATDRLMVAVHYYDPYDYTLAATYNEWGHTATAANTGSEKDVTEAFKKLYDKYIANGIPVYIGEFGCVNRNTERQQAFQRYYLEYVCKAAKTYGMSAFIWDNGAKGAGTECHAFFDHATGEYCSTEAKAAMETVVKAFNTEDENYTLDTIYTNAPQ